MLLEILRFSGEECKEGVGVDERYDGGCGEGLRTGLAGLLCLLEEQTKSMSMCLEDENIKNLYIINEQTLQKKLQADISIYH